MFLRGQKRKEKRNEKRNEKQKKQKRFIIILLLRFIIIYDIRLLFYGLNDLCYIAILGQGSSKVQYNILTLTHKKAM
jgi:hypothetical protein